MAPAAATHHSSQRGEWRDLYEAPRGQRTASAEATYDALRSQTTSVAGDTEFFSLYAEELGGTRPDRLYEVRPPQRENQLVEGVPAPGLADPRTGYRSAQDLVYTPSSSQAPCALRGADGRTVGGSADDYILLFVTWDYGAETWTLKFLLVVEVVSVSEVLKVSQDRVQQRLVKHGVFQQRLPSRSLTLLFRVVTELFILHRHLPFCR